MNPLVDSSLDIGYARPRDPVEIWLTRRWEEVLGFGVGIRENFFGIGGNSLDAARIINSVLDEFDVRLPLNAVTENPTVEDLAARLREQGATPRPGPLVELQGGDGTCPPLFLVHPADGQVGAYCHLARALGDEFTVFGLRAAGLYDDAEPITTVTAMAHAYVEQLRAVAPAGPYFLGGWAPVAYEIACQLTAAGAEVALLAAIDPALVAAPVTRWRDDGDLFGMLVSDEITESAFRALPTEARLAYVLNDWRIHDLVPLDETLEFVTRSSRVWQGNRAAVATWRPRPYPGRLDVFGDRSMATDSLPANDRRAHECVPDGDDPARRLAAGLRELIG